MKQALRWTVLVLTIVAIGAIGYKAADLYGALPEATPAATPPVEVPPATLPTDKDAERAAAWQAARKAAKLWPLRHAEPMPPPPPTTGQVLPGPPPR